MTTYPGHREADVVLRDGSTVHVRPVRAGDAPAVERLLRGLSDWSRWLRFFSGFPDLARAVRWATEVDYDHRYGLVATIGGDGRVVGHAGFERQPDHPERAEVALEVADTMQGRGLGTILLGQLAEAAHEVGVQVLDAEVLPENHQMIKVFRDSGFPVRTHTLPGMLLVEFPTSLSAEAVERGENVPVSAGRSAVAAADRGVDAHHKAVLPAPPMKGADPMATCPRCGPDAEYVPGDIYSLLNCDFCGDTIDVTDLAGSGADGAVRPLPAPAERPRGTAGLRVA